MQQWMFFLAVAIMGFVPQGFAQTAPNIEKMKSILKLNKPQAKIMILGTFHFKDAGLDGYKPKHDVDILSPERQKQVEEVINLIATKFKPTKIALEWKPEHQAMVDERFSKYLAGEFEIKSNEVYQLGFRLGKELGHAKLFLVDTPGRWFESVEDQKEFAKKNGQKAYLKGAWGKAYQEYYEFSDKLKTELELRDYFVFLNHEEKLKVSHGDYLVDSFAIGDGETFPGVDGFVSSWYNRNLRIFSNLVRLTDGPEERILLIIGAGHVPILKHAVESSPQFEFVDVASVLGR